MIKKLSNGELSKLRTDKVVDVFLEENETDITRCFIDAIMVIATLHSMIKDDKTKALMKQFTLEAIGESL
jgi:hypothetical protein